MELSSDLVSQFVKVTSDKQKPKDENTVYGTVVEYDGEKFVRFDGSELLTPMTITTSVQPGDRVSVMVKDHTATVTGNVSDPSASSGNVQDIGSKITEVEILVADKVSTKYFDAEVARIDTLVADNVTIKDKLNANEAHISNLEADKASIADLEATNATIENLRADMITAEDIEAKYATIENLEATNADIRNLTADFGEFEILTADRLDATDAVIENLNSTYANIDFANIGSAAIEQFFAKSGMIEDVVVGDGTITGTLVGVTIKGDLIEGGTVVADKLVIKGDDGLYYKLNTDGVTTETEQTDYNSLNGSIITAKSITATKISVKDLVAFDATIGGFKITDDSIYSGVKSNVGNTTRGIYLDNDGQIAFGDSRNFLKFYKDSDGVYKLVISAASIKFGASSKPLDEAMKETIKSTIEEFYQSTSPITLTGGSWSSAQPTWVDGKYIWRRTLVTYGDDTTKYLPSETGVCITGNTGPKGVDGLQGERGEQGIQGPKGDTGTAGSSSYFHIKYSTVANPTAAQMTETPSKYIGTYVDNVAADSTDPSKYTWQQFEGSQGAKGDQGIPGTNGDNGKTSYLHIAYANSSDGRTGFSTSVSTGKLYIGQYTDFVSTDSSDPTAYKWSKIKGETGAPGADGQNGIGISKTEVFYYLSDYNYTQIGGSWSTEVPQWVNGKYYWQKVVTTYTDNSSSESEPVCITGAKGSTGSAGSTGQGVTSITTEFYSSTSNTTQTGGAWGTTMPEWAVNRYLWTRNRIVYKNPTSTEYTDPLCDSSWAAIGEAKDAANNAQNTADNAANTANSAYSRINEAYIDIDALNASISTLVTGQNGESLMTQTDDGWTFSLAGVLNTLNTVSNGLNDVGSDLNDVNSAVDTLNQSVADLGEYTEYIKFGVDGGKPCIILGETDSNFKVIITNTDIRFMEGSVTPASISNQALNIDKAVVNGELQQGNFVWLARSNGNYGLAWKG